MEESSLSSMANNEPEIITDKEQMRKWSRSMRAQGKTIGLIPTMGYLHHGHISLIQEAQKHTQLTVVSIYVNPGQFSPSEDLSTYPSDFQGDIEKLKALPSCVDVVFHPKNLYDYGNNSSISDETNIEEGKEGGGEKAVVISCIEESDSGHETWVTVEKLEKGMCGKSRPVFFRGVATVVTKLFNIVEPDVAVFGKKDYQQWQIIRRMVRDLDFSINVIGLEIVRDADGLAMSSRNVHLSPEEREKALSINKSLLKAKFSAQKGQVSCRVLRNSVTQAILEAGGKIDYAEIVDQENLEAVEEIESPVIFCVAAWFGKVRLIDNMEISPPTSTECSVVEPVQLDYTDIFTTNRIFTSRDALIKWVRDMGRRHGLIIVTMRSDSGNGERPARLFLCCERSGSYKKRSKNTTEEGDNTKLAKVASTKKCGCPFKLKGERVSPSDEWILFVACGEHNHSTTTHMEGRSYAGKLHDDETSLLVDMTNNSAKPKEILTILKQRDAYNASTIKTIYNARRKYKKSEKGRRLEV